MQHMRWHYSANRSKPSNRAKSRSKLTMRQLNRRCGPLSDATTARIQALPLQQLESLVEALLDFAGASDLEAWLSGHSG